MGIPKFFRYISERYPMTSQLIQENKIPEFDNLYLDFNGIIHNCSHPNDEDAHFRLSEEQIFTSIFAYVDHLFGKIKPKKLFFMAVDGVAPRAKMNQQRSRRFRTAKEAKEVREKALKKGEKLPDEKAFDSNCITPGTPFMTRLSAQLRYFINKKITEDSNWRDVEVVLSGHEVPGEGEHKIMEYIRLSRAQPDYNPNVRHCLYGLDADLIMLGLLSHDPHFCLLREEVKFGHGPRKKGNGSLESITFYLLHLSLMREYLDLEFKEIETLLPFDYKLERIIDDFILLAVFVGNDFLPNLPDLHIHENGLEKLFEVYKKVLPGMDGYLNESGTINTKRLQVVLNEMTLWEQEVFEREYGDLNWFKGKQAKHVKAMELAEKRAKLVLTAPQRTIFDQVKAFVLEHRQSHVRGARLAMPNDFSARERKFIGKLAEELNLGVRWDEYDDKDDDVNLVTLRFPEPEVTEVGLEVAVVRQEGQIQEGEGDEDEKVGEGIEEDGRESEWEDDVDDEESRAAVDRVLKKYEKAPVMRDDDGGGFEARHERGMNQKMDEWKRGYYKGKLNISYNDEKAMGDLVYKYVEGLQWVMHYYYSGVASWGWFYNYHYAPRISDLRNVDKMSFEFELGKPFRPYEQLMGVLPVASKEHIPAAYQDLMCNSESPIRDFYPEEFEQDLNGKKQDWEAIVKIPFIDEQRLLKAMASREHRLSKEEAARNTFGSSTKFSYSTGESTFYASSLPGFFPDIHRCMCVTEDFDLPTLDGLHLVPGLCDGVKIGAEALAGFPSLQTLPHTSSLGIHGVNVHGTESRNKSIVVHIENPEEGKRVEEIAERMVGERVWMGWPFLQEGQVAMVSDGLFRYEKVDVVLGGRQVKKVVASPHAGAGVGQWRGKAERIEQVYSKRCGVITGPVEVLLHIRPLKGLKRLETGAFVKDYEGQEKEVEQALQMCLTAVSSEDPRYLERAAPPMSEEFPEGSKIFFLGEHAYGVAAQVQDTTERTLSVVLAFFPTEKAENAQFKQIVNQRKVGHYFPSFKVADMLGMSGRALSKITASFMVITSDGQKTNLGLSLKFEAKALKVIDYTKKDGRVWEFSEKAVELIREYKTKFPEIFKTLDAPGDAMAHARNIFTESDPDERVKEIKGWLKSKGVRDLEAVTLFCDQLSKETVLEIEKLASCVRESRESKKTSKYKMAVVKGIPRQAVLKPSHAVYRLQSQRFALGDRVTMVQDSGSVPLACKGVVVGLNAKSMDVVWDVPFMAGTTLSDRCSLYRGLTVEFDTCLNLTNPQFVVATSPKAPPVSGPGSGSQVIPFKPRFGPHPVIQPPPGQAAASGFKPSLGPPVNSQNRHMPVQIMSNPNRNGRGMFLNHNHNHHHHHQQQHYHANGRGGFQNGSRGQQQQQQQPDDNDDEGKVTSLDDDHDHHEPEGETQSQYAVSVGHHHHHHHHHGQVNGYGPGRGGHGHGHGLPPFLGRGGLRGAYQVVRGRGMIPRGGGGGGGGGRGRGRGGVYSAVQS